MKRMKTPIYKGCILNGGITILGALIGDILGSSFEFSDYKWDDPLMINLYNTESQITDDTVLTAAVADWLVNDIEKDYVDELIKLIDENQNFNIVLFFGKSGVKFLNKYKEFNDLKNKLTDSNEKIKYTSINKKFIHPGKRGDNYNLVDWKENLLE